MTMRFIDITTYQTIQNPLPHFVLKLYELRVSKGTTEAPAQKPHSDKLVCHPLESSIFIRVLYIVMFSE